MISNRSPKRKSLKKSSFYQGIIFFLSTVGSIICLIFYLWVFKEIDESMLAYEVQNSTAKELINEINEIKNKVETLSRSDLITSRAKNELGMIPADPETLIIAINYKKVVNFWQNHSQNIIIELRSYLPWL